MIAPALASLTASIADSMEPIALSPTFQAPPGAEQTYFITFRLWEVERRIGSLLRDEAVEEQAALYVRYRMLEPAPNGALRVELQAQAADARTGAPLPLPAWSDVMHITRTDVDFERGDVPAWASMVSQPSDLLAGWFGRGEDVPKDPVSPGITWDSRRGADSLGLEEIFEGSDASFEINGTFVGWTEGVSENAQRRAAIVHERYHGSMSVDMPPEVIPLDCDDECYEEFPLFTLQVAIEGETEIWLVPGDFPLGGRTALSMDFSWIYNFPLGRFQKEVEIMRFDGSVPFAIPTPISSGEMLHGALGLDSLLRAEEYDFINAPADLYAFEGTAGHHVLAKMTSEDFDPLLVLLGDAGDVLTGVKSRFDADEGSFTLSAELPYTGIYYLKATTPLEGDSGDYALSLELGPEHEDDLQDESADVNDSWSDWDWWEWDANPYDLDYTQCAAFHARKDKAALIENGVPATRILGPDTDLEDCDAMPDLYRLDGGAGTEVLLQLISDDFDTFLVLMDSEGNVIESDDDTAGDYHAQIFATLPESGTYFVLAGETPYFDDRFGGRYTLYLDTGDAAHDILEQCGYGRFRTVVELDTSEAAGNHADYFRSWESPDHCYPAFKLFSFQGEAGDVVTIDAVSYEFDTVLALTDANFATLAEDDDSGGAKNARIETTLDASGLYYVKLMGYWPDSYGDYELSLKVNDVTPAAAGDPIGHRFADGVPVAVSPWELDPAVMPDCYALWEANALFLASSDMISEDLNDNEAFVHNACATRLFAYSFDALNDDEALIELYADHPRAYLALYDADWRLVAESDTATDAHVEIFEALPGAGQYYIVAGAYDHDDAPGSYTLYLDVGPALFDACWTPEALEIVVGQTVTHEREVFDLPSFCNGLSDWYELRGSAGDSITLKMSSETFVTFLGLYDPTFAPLAFAESSHTGDDPGSHGSAVITVTLPMTGMYYLEANVTPVDWATVGTYTLSYGRE